MKNCQNNFHFAAKVMTIVLIFTVLQFFSIRDGLCNRNVYDSCPCSNGNVSWDVTTYDDNNNVIKITFCDCSGNVYTWPSSIVNHPDPDTIGYVYFLTDSVRFTESGNSWTATGYTGSTATYAVMGNPVGVTILFGGHTYNTGIGNPPNSYLTGNSGNSLSNLRVITSEGKLNITFVLSIPAQAKVEIFDDHGHQVNAFDAGLVNKGETTIQIPQITSIPRGNYFVRITAGGLQKVQKIIINQ